MIGEIFRARHQAAYILGIEARRNGEPRESNPIKYKGKYKGFDFGAWYKQAWFDGWDAANRAKRVKVHVKVLGKYFDYQM